MKKFIIVFLSLIVLSENSMAAKKNKTENVKDVKTFDFDRIFRETEEYFNAAENWKRIKCTPKSTFVCTKRECPQIKVTDAYIIIDRSKKTISLCKSKICKFFKATINQTGVFTVVKVKDSDGVLIKILGDSRYKEINTIGLDAYISNGECEEVKS